MARLTKWIAYGAIIVAAVAIAALVAWDFLGDYYVFQTLETVDGKKLVIEAETAWEIGPGFYYRIVEAGKSGPRTYFGSGSTEHDPHFTLIKATSSPLVGLVENANPDIVLVIWDLASGKSWPSDISHDHARKLLSAFGAESAPLRLSRDVPGGTSRRFY